MVKSINYLPLAQQNQYLLETSDAKNADEASKVSFSANPKKETEEEIKVDTILDATLKNKTKAKIETIKSIPSYISRGLGGDPNSNFHEFMQVSKIPYFLGGPVIIATVLAGKSLLDMKANKSAKFNAKGMALGCALYYIMAGLAKKCIDVPVKLFRDVDLNHPYVDVVYNNPEDKDGKCSKKYEYHNIYESSKFIRWDLMYDKTAKENKDINSKYNAIAQRMRMSENMNDSDSEVKPRLMSLIKQARAWKYIIGAFAVMFGVGLANQQAIKEEFCTGTFDKIKRNILHKSFKPDFKHSLTSLKTKVINPIKNSFISLWKGNESSKASRVLGKFAIIGFLASVLIANISILKSTNKKGTNFVKHEEVNS